jgi:adenine-specific DNA-methyltransferase
MQNQAIQVEITSAERRKLTGSHYTPPLLADFIARQIVDSEIGKLQSETLNVLDPAVGDGELLFSLLRELDEHGYRKINVNGFDTDAAAIKLATARINSSYPDLPINLKDESFIDVSLEYQGDDFKFSLFAPQIPPQKYDLVIANPPYVRTQVLGAVQAQKLARQFALTGRVDLYHAFICGIASVLRPAGLAGIIVSNRFMTTKSGAEVRNIINREFDILHIWDLGDTRLFEAAVLPAVLLLRKRSGHAQAPTPKFTSIYSTAVTTPKQHCKSIFAALNKEGEVTVKPDSSYMVRQGNLDPDYISGGVWRIATKKSDQWLATVEAHTYCTFKDVGKIRVGVKTTADKIFIRSDWNLMPKSERPELLKPLITHHVARRYKAHPTDKQILYPHQVVDGKRTVVDLQKFPRAAKYLNSHRAALESREYVIEAGRNWFEIWVPQDPASWSKPKMVFRDISEAPTFWMDIEGAVVNGDCYWLTCDHKNDDDHLLWLCLAIGNSSFIEVFYDHRFNNKLYAGRRRFMTQYVEKFPLPDPKSSTAKEIVRKARRLYTLLPLSETESLEKELNGLVWQSFGLTLEESPG